MPEIYYTDELVTLYRGDCLSDEIAPHWLAADVLVTDPPYGIDWRPTTYGMASTREAIANDKTTAVRDQIIRLMGDKQSIVFGSSLLPPPDKTRQVLVWQKPPNAGFMGAVGGFRRDWEAIYLLGKWPTQPATHSGVIQTRGSFNDYQTGHPHSKPIALMEYLIDKCSAGVVADPFAGSGATLVAARTLGRRAVGVELEERYCEIIARRLSQDVLDLGTLA